MFGALDATQIILGVFGLLGTIFVVLGTVAVAVITYRKSNTALENTKQNSDAIKSSIQGPNGETTFDVLGDISSEIKGIRSDYADIQRTQADHDRWLRRHDDRFNSTDLDILTLRNVQEKNSAASIVNIESAIDHYQQLVASGRQPRRGLLARIFNIH